MSTEENYFVPENEDKEKLWVHKSESEKYRVDVRPFQTKPGCWNYTQGKVFREGEAEPIAVVNRNYSSFPAFFIENHPSGHDFLVTGADYQGLTVVDMTTGERRDYLPAEAEDGVAFCAISYSFDPKTQTLLIGGCIWACPYEYRLFEFSDPIGKGWPELVLEGGYFDSDPREPTFHDDGTIVFYQSEYPTPEEDEATEEEIDRTTLPLAAKKTVRIEEGKLVLVEDWVSEKEQARRAKSIEDERIRKEKLDKYRAEDPLYLRLTELTSGPEWKKSEYEWIGVTFEGWCPEFKENEQRIGRSLYSSEEVEIEIDLAMVSGPIKVSSKKPKAETRFFPHSIEGMDEAITFARTHLP